MSRSPEAVPADTATVPAARTSAGSSPAIVAAGVEWIVDATGCRPEPLRSIDVFAALFDRIVADLELHPLQPAAWHTFAGAGGITGLLLLTESHLACHTFPERGFAAINLYCCRERAEWRWETELARALGARHVSARRIMRGSGPGA